MACRRNFVVAQPLIGQAAIAAVSSVNAVFTPSNLQVYDGCQMFIPSKPPTSTFLCAGCGCHEAFHDKPPLPIALSGSSVDEHHHDLESAPNGQENESDHHRDSAEQPSASKYMKIEGFSRRETLFLKQFIASDSKPVQCKVCLKCFSDESKLELHVKHHVQNENLECLFCFKVFHQEEERHDKKEFLKHVVTHSYQPNPWSCSRCGQRFSQFAGLSLHLKQQECKTEDPMKSNVQPPPSASVQAASEKKGAPNGASFEVVPEIKRFVNGLNQDQLKFIAPFLMVPGTSVQCSVCLRVFTERFSLPGDHVAVHSSESRRLECMFCLMTMEFGQELKMLEHMVQTHSGHKQPYLCRKCNRQFIRRSDLTNHVRKTC
eukprot:TRINITY_DN16842_c0_g1_i1.p1 TRINITY_DN16842_c0_g1~~TRINITY_DN16842_c0_g1_i1.p1  ORF type:complete len:375 (-),score=74.38 TRINITY_DN16842_c0_g1_i1:38-1162(-)